MRKHHWKLKSFAGGVPMKKVVIVQSNYIPWKGYFDLIAAADEFILFDDVQYTRRDWRNRNKIKTPSGLMWLTVPVQVKGKYLQTIRDTRIDGLEWSASHWAVIKQNYSLAPYFDEVADWLEPIYRGEPFELLSILNRRLIEAICNYLRIETVISSSWDYELYEGKSKCLAMLCHQAGGDMYISGPAARSYIEEQPFTEQGIGVSWFDYEAYPDYPQLWQGFEHGVTVLDLLFNCGKEAPSFMKYVKK